MNKWTKEMKEKYESGWWKLSIPKGFPCRFYVGFEPSTTCACNSPDLHQEKFSTNFCRGWRPSDKPLCQFYEPLLIPTSIPNTQSIFWDAIARKIPILGVFRLLFTIDPLNPTPTDVMTLKNTIQKMKDDIPIEKEDD